MTGRDAVPSNGRRPHSDVPDSPKDELTTKELLSASAELSRKMQWAIGTAWYSATGQRAPKKQVDYLATKLAADVIDALYEVYKSQSKP